MNGTTQLLNIIEDLETNGVVPSVTLLPSATKRKTRKSMFGVKKTASRRRSGKAQMQNKIYHTSAHN